MIVGEVFVDEYDEDDIRRRWEFVITQEAHYALSLDEDANNFRKWVRRGFGSWRFIGWLLPEDSDRPSFDQWGQATEEIISNYVKEKVAEHA